MRGSKPRLFLVVDNREDYEDYEIRFYAITEQWEPVRESLQVVLAALWGGFFRPGRGRFLGVGVFSRWEGGTTPVEEELTTVEGLEYQWQFYLDSVMDDEVDAVLAAAVDQVRKHMREAL